MAGAVAIPAQFDEAHDDGSSKPLTPQWITGTVDERGWAAVLFRPAQWDKIEQQLLALSDSSQTQPLEVYTSKPTGISSALPTYEEAILDLAPSYMARDDSLPLRVQDYTVPPPGYSAYTLDLKPRILIAPMLIHPHVDLYSTETFRQHAGKKAKQAAKKAQQGKWADDPDDDDENKDTAGDGAGGGGGGGGGGGDNGGGAGDGGDDGDDGKKDKGKKGKKNNRYAWEEQEEEEKEEEEADAAAGTAAGVEANAAEDWGTAGGKKGKKNKKQNAWEVDNEEEKRKKEEESAAAFAAATTNAVGDANPDDEWATDKKAKKGKKGGKAAEAVPPPPPPHPAPAAARANPFDVDFDTLDLDDPILDLNYGSTDAKHAGYGGLGGWDTGWDSGPKWDFPGMAEGAEVKKSTKATGKSATESNNPWKAGAKKQDEKIPGAFDFGFQSPGDGANADSSAPVSKANDAWGASTAKKDKKNGKKEVGPSEPARVTLAEPDQEEHYFNWGGTGKDKKGQKTEQFPPPPPPVALVDEKAAVKKGKNGKSTDQAGAVKIGDPNANAIHGAATDNPADDHWSSFGKKDKKDVGKKGAKQEVMRDPEDTIVPQSAAVTALQNNGIGSFWNMGNKGQAKAANAYSTFSFDDEDPIIPMGDEGAATDWMNWDKPKDAKKKGKKGAEEDMTALPPPPPPPPPPAPAAVPTKNSNTWGAGSLWGSSAKPNKEKDAKTKNGKESSSRPAEEPIIVPDAAMTFDIRPEDDFAGWTVGQNGKKKKDSPKAEPVKVNGKVALPPVDAATLSKSTVTDDKLGLWGPSKNDKKAKKNSGMDPPPPPPPPAPTPPDQGLTPPGSALNDVVDDGWGAFGSSKIKKKEDKKDPKKGTAREGEGSKVLKAEDTKTGKDAKSKTKNAAEPNPVVEPYSLDEPESKEGNAAKAAKSFWGTLDGGASTKPKTGKELLKEKKEKEEQARKDKEDAEKARKSADAKGFEEYSYDDPDEIVDIVDLAPTKTINRKGGSTALSNTASKDIKDSKKNGSKAIDAAAEAAIAKPPTPPEPAKEEKKSAGWGLFGGGVKSAKKTPVDNKKEIATDAVANQSAPLAESPKDTQAVTKTSPSTAKASLAKTKTTTTVVAPGSVAERIQTLQGNVKDKFDVRPAPPRQAATDRRVDPEPSEEAKRSGHKSTSKATTASLPANKTKDIEALSQPIKANRAAKASTAMAGAFPDDDVTGVYHGANLSPPKNSKESNEKKDGKKSEKPPKNGTKPTKADSPVRDMPPPPAAVSKKDKASVPKESKLPTPPPEEEFKSPKKNRPRVVRDTAGSSWGFWGAAPKADPKKDAAPKDKHPDSRTKSRSSAPGLTRSKSARKASERDVEKSSGSSGSDKQGKAETRPRGSRGMSFSSVFGMGSPPARSKSNRHSASAPKPGRTRHSVDVDPGMLSPRDDEPLKVSAKAAKVMGIGKPGLGRSQSMKEKGKQRAVPDPYAIDDDIVMVDGAEDFVYPNERTRPTSSRNPQKEKQSKSRSKRASGPDPVLSSGDDALDDAMDDAGPVKSPGGLAFETPRRTPLKRSNTSSKKTPGLMGFFGSFKQKERRLSEDDDRKKRRAANESGDETGHRKRAIGDDDEASKRVRRDREKLASKRADNQERGSDGSPSTGRDDAGMGKDRKSGRERDVMGNGLPAARDAQADDRARRRERDRREHEDKRARRSDEERKRQAEKLEKRERLEKAERDEEARRERHARRREAELANDPRPKTNERRRSHMDPPSRPDDRPRQSRRMTSERSSRHKPAPPPDDYFDPRNGTHAGASAPPDANRPYLSNGGDKTSSWVNQVNMEPPLPPPVEPTVIDPPPDMREVHDREEGIDDRRERRSRRHGRYDREPEPYEDGERSRRKEGRREGYYPDVAPPRGMGEGGGGGKRGSWLKKIAGL